MKKFAIFFILILFPFLFPQNLNAQTPKRTDVEYIDEFISDITINKDTTINIRETIKVYFPIEKHGIYRNIPSIYRNGLKNINIRPNVISVRDENGEVKYSDSIEDGNLVLKIGDKDKYIKGWKTYTIDYSVQSVLQRFDEHDELYWNITGSEWPQDILKAKAQIHSQYAPITKQDCFSGAVGTQNKDCFVSLSSEKDVTVETNEPIESGEDFTVVVALSKRSELQFPKGIALFFIRIRDNWGYAFTPIPLVLVLYMWLKKGRDRKFEEDSIYISKGKEKTAGFFERKYLPTVYSPIQGLTPSELGTLLDERVDMKDVVSEIVELARLGFLTIERFKTKKILKDKEDFIFHMKKDSNDKLQKHQKYLLDSLWEFADEKGQVKLSQLKEKFYKKLGQFKKLLYEEMQADGLFDGNPDTIRNIWMGVVFGSAVLLTFLLVLFIVDTGNPIPLFFLWLSTFLALPFAYKMPRRTGKGYALTRQISGLKFYLGKGKWRTEVHEKHLFLEEMLPISISLGIVNKLAREMAELGVKPPDYTSGFTTSNFASGFSNFTSSSAGIMTSFPNSSGGSGFSGGGSGGGFGGGGGGSW